MEIVSEKHKLRQFILNKLKNQNKNERIEKSKLIASKIISSREFREAQIVMFYAAMSYEVETVTIIEQAFHAAKKVLLPKMITDTREIFPYEIKEYWKETELCRYGFREPLASLDSFDAVDSIDLVLVPGLAFDLSNHRLGRGAGYYDRFLSTLSNHTTCVGVAFDFQVQQSVPYASHDQVVDFVVSNS